MSQLLNKIRLLILLMSFSIFFTAASYASSFYSSKYFGKEASLAGTQGMGMGGLGIALIDTRGLNFLNPATLVPGGITRLSVNFISESISQKNADGAGHSNYMNANGLQFLIPFGNLSSLSAGIAPSFIADYDFTESGGSGSEAYESLIHGKGSLNRAFLSLFWNIKNKIYLAGSVNYNFGKYDEQWKVDYKNELYTDTSDILRTHYRGMNFTYGILYNVMQDLKLGLVLTTPLKLQADAHYAYNFKVKNDEDEYDWGKTDLENLSVKLPLAWGAGISYQLKKRWIFGAEYYTQAWSDYEIDGKKGAEDLKTTRRVSVGCQYRHSTDPFDKYYKHIPIRLGFYQRNLYFSYGNTNDIIEYAGTIGLGLPFFFSQVRLDLALAIGKRGSLEKNLVEENMVNFMITITGGEKWFVRRKKN